MNWKLKSAIMAAGVTQRKLSEIVDVSEQKMTAFTTGRAMPSPALQFKIATLLCRPVVELFPRGVKL